MDVNKINKVVRMLNPSKYDGYGLQISEEELLSHPKGRKWLCEKIYRVKNIRELKKLKARHVRFIDVAKSLGEAVSSFKDQIVKNSLDR